MMTSVNGEYSRREWERQSLCHGGLGIEKRRRVWLHLLDLGHLESQLEASTSKLTESNLVPETSASSSKTSPLLDGNVPLDGDGWQIPDTSNLGVDREDDGQGGEEEEWNLATSKRQRRRKRASHVNGKMERSTSGATYTATSAGTTEESDSREHSQSRIETNGHAEDAGEEERKKRRKEKKKAKKKNNASNGVDIEASGILMPSSELVEEERDESLQRDWVQTEAHTKGSTGSGRKTEAHRDEQQVALDINRSFIGLKDGKLKALRREQLSEVIIGVLRRHPGLNYYQGYHDIISVLLVVLIPQAEGIADVEKSLESVVEVASRLSLHLLRDNMTVNMEPTMGHLKVLRNLLRLVDANIANQVESASPLPYFALPWLISLFAHELDGDLTANVMDYILARGPISVLYLAIALILHDKEDDETNSEDAAEKHHSLSQLPALISTESLPDLLTRSDSLLQKYPLSLTGKIMGPRSIFYTWSQLPLSLHQEDVPTPWTHADALAEAILVGGTENIVIDALPTPSVSEDEDEDRWAEEEKEKRRRRGGGKKSGKKQRRDNLVAFVGAVGAVGVAALLMYGAGRGGVSFG